MARTYAGFLFAGTKDGSPPRIKMYPLKAAAYYEGAVLRLSATTGSAAMAAAAGTAILGVLGCNVTSAQSSSGTTGPFPVYMADGPNLFKAKMIATSAPQALVGDVVDVALASTYNYRLQGTASTKVVSIWDFKKDEAAATHTGVEYYVSFSKPIFGQAKTGNDY